MQAALVTHSSSARAPILYSFLLPWDGPTKAILPAIHPANWRRVFPPCIAMTQAARPVDIVQLWQVQCPDCGFVLPPTTKERLAASAAVGPIICPGCEHELAYRDGFLYGAAHD